MSKGARLRQARRIRSAVASELQRLAVHDITIWEALRDPPDALGHARIFDVLIHTPKLGPDGAKKVLTTAKVWPYSHVEELSEDEIEAVLKRLPPRVFNSSQSD